jgi:hypothetical protein
MPDKYQRRHGSWNLDSMLSLRKTADLRLAIWPEMKPHYCCTVICIPDCVVKPLYVALTV